MTCEIIAEIGSNWKTLGGCLTSIEQAAKCGANVVKFQLYSHEALYGYAGELPGELPQAWLPTLKACADANKIEFMCSAFSPELLAVVDPYVRRHKIASAENEWPELREAALATGKPVLISCGGIGPQTKCTLESLWGAHNHKHILMYCVAAYPAPYTNFSVLKYFEGFSDHTLGIHDGVKALRYANIKVIEKHVNFISDLETPDSPHSIDAELLTHLCNAAKSVGNLESDFRKFSKRRLVDGKMVRLKQ